MAPRIEAPSIEEHVRVRTDRILTAATALFHSRGYRSTDMEDIARAAGLARNSLYRYYPNKDHILLACVQRDMADLIAGMAALDEAHPDPRKRLGAWLDAQVAFAASPAHGTVELMGEIRQLAPELRKEIMALHELPNSVLERTLRQILRGRRRDLGLTVAMIAGMVERAAGEAIRRGQPAAVQRELRRAVLRILED